MSRTTHFAGIACFAIGLALLLNPPSAQARRPSTIASKTYSSGKFIKVNNDITLDKPADDSSTTDDSVASRPTCKPVREPASVARSTAPVHVYKPLHASLPHATKQFPKFVAAQAGR